VAAGHRATGTTRPTGSLTYTWNTAKLGGRFYSNQDVWWTFTPSTSGASLSSTGTKGTLQIGADSTAANKGVTEYLDNPDANLVLPWIAPLQTLDRVTAVTTTGRLEPANLTGWFQDMAYLTSFDGQGLNTANATSLERLFYNDVRLTTLSNIEFSLAKCTSLKQAFSNCIALTSIDLHNWRVASVKDFSQMFAMTGTNADNNKLTSINIADWSMRTSAERGTATFKDMFSGLKFLEKITVYDDVVLQGTGFDDGLYFHTPSDGSWSRVEGSSAMDDLIGTTASLALLYPDTEHTGPLQHLTYQWCKGVFKGTFQNTNVWWYYNTDTISVGLYDKTASVAGRTVTEYDDGTDAHKLPWRSLIKNPNPTAAELKKEGATPVRHFVSSVSDGVVIPTNLMGWFDGYTLLQSFDGSGLDFSAATSMANLFRDDMALTTVTGIGTSGKPGSALTSLRYAFGSTSDTNMAIATLSDTAGWDTSHVMDFTGTFRRVVKITALDLSGWDMRASIAPASPADGVGVTYGRTDMLAFCSGLRTITLSGGSAGAAILTDTGFGNSLTGLGNKAGMWVLTSNADGTGDELWFDTTDNLAIRYGLAGEGSAAAKAASVADLEGTLIYRWDGTRLGGRFPSNPNAWWKYTKGGSDSTKIGLLELGTDGGRTGDKFVYENAVNGDLPWRLVVDNYATAIKKVTTMGHIAPAVKGEDGPVVGGSLSKWFQGHTALTSVDLSGADTRYVTDLSYLFDGCTALSALNFQNADDTDEWDTSYVTTMAGMFRNCTALVNLSSLAFLETGSVQSFASMFEGMTATQSIYGIDAWDTTAGTDFSGMFKNCQVLKQLDLTSWTVGPDDNVTGLFANCFALSKLTLGETYTATQTVQPTRRKFYYISAGSGVRYDRPWYSN